MYQSGDSPQFDLLEAMPDAVVVTDEDGKMLSFNAQAERMFGWPREEVCGKSIDLLVPLAARSAHAHLRESYSSSPSPRSIRTGKEVRAVRKDGVELDVDISLAWHSFGHRRYVVAAIRDRSEYVLAQAEQRRLEGQLMQAQKMECIGQLAGGIAHDFNNLVSVVLGTSSVLLEELPKDSPLVEDIQSIERAARSSAGLAKQLLAFSRKQQWQPQVVAVGDLVVQTASMLRRAIGAGVEFVLAIDADTGFARVDPGQLEQVVVNLAINARDAMPKGGKLSLATQAVAVDAGSVREHSDVAPGRYVMITVRDTGSGIDSSILPRIFEPFFTTKADDTGTGLGLSTVHGIVKQSGGYITVKSEVGKGTTFSVYLPQLEAEVEPASTAHDAPERGAAQGCSHGIVNTPEFAVVAHGPPARLG